MTRLRSSLALFTLLAALFVTTSSAAAVVPTDLDASYGTAGISPFQPTIDASSVIRTAQLPDGKLLVGHTLQTGNLQPLITRLNADGSVDGSFGVGGTVAVPLAANEIAYLYRLLVAADGTIFVLGSDIQPGPGVVYSPVIWAFAPNGATRTDFGTNGKKLLPGVGSTTNFLRGAAFAPDGKLVLVSQVPVGGKAGISITILHQSGAVANSGSRGEAGIDVDPAGMTVTANGRILVAAYYGTPGGSPQKVFAFTSTAAFDSSWGSGGGQSFGLSGTNTGLYGMLPLGNRAAAIGLSAAGASVTMYEADGTLTASAGANGTNRFAPFNAANSTAYAGTVTGAGKLLVVGPSNTGPSNQAFLARINPDGTPDPSFFGNGVAPIPGVTGTPFTIDQQFDGKYLIASVNAGSATVTIRRIWGEAQPQAATAGFSKSLKSKMKARKLRTIKGTAAGTQLTNVELAIQKVDAKQLKKKKRCSFVKSTKTSIKKVKAVKGKCPPTVWIPATGVADWAVKLRKALKPGRYVISVRATGLAGVGPIASKKVKLTK